MKLNESETWFCALMCKLCEIENVMSKRINRELQMEGDFRGLLS